MLNQLGLKELDLETLHAEINTFFLAYNAALLPKVAEAKESANKLEVRSSGGQGQPVKEIKL